MKVVVLGAGGQLGRALTATAPASHVLTALSSAQLDITDAAAVARMCAELQPEVVLNAAAYTQVDRAESELERAFEVNRDGVANLVAGSTTSTRLIHVSTDFVFDGNATRPWLPTAPVNPLSVYGQSKSAGEAVLLTQAPLRSCIVRTAWLYAAEGRNFLNTMLGLMASRDSLSVVDDQRGTPTSVLSLAAALWRLVDLPMVRGVLHWTDAGEASWYEFASEIQAQALRLGLLASRIPLHPIPTSAYPTPAARPAYSVLDKTDTWQVLGMRALPWQEELERVLHLKRAALHSASGRDSGASGSV
jgi:dTDP-4-dehydrorhamnose reductase